MQLAVLAAGCDTEPSPCGNDGGAACPTEGGAALDTPPANQADGPATQPDGSPNPADGPANSPDGPGPDAPVDTAVPGGPDAPLGDLPDVMAGTARPLDILFLIDNSPSMKEEQQNLRRNFPAFIEQLRRIRGVLPDLHLGVVSSDLGAGSQPLGNGGCARPGGDRGIFQTKPTCGLANNALFATSLNDGTTNNFAGTLENTFSCMADLGTAGCGYEHQLQATRVALYEAVSPQNKGFLREDAVLAIFILSDEDDCSAEPNSNLFIDDASFPMTTASFRCSQTGHVCNGVSPPLTAFDAPLENCRANDAGRLIHVREVVDSIRALKKQPDRDIVVAGFFGWPTNPVGARYRYIPTMQGVDVGPICQSASGDAAVGLRLKQFVESFGTGGSFFTICQDDFRAALQVIGQSLAVRL